MVRQSPIAGEEELQVKKLNITRPCSSQKEGTVAACPSLRSIHDFPFIVCTLCVDVGFVVLRGTGGWC
ncbi:MAG: hypothetical protein HC767_07595 [Akkermansiaceae bacterium]|nr:hypothetical protein [Akkermansiaceae bacterium]